MRASGWHQFLLDQMSQHRGDRAVQRVVSASFSRNQIARLFKLLPRHQTGLRDGGEPNPLITREGDFAGASEVLDAEGFHEVQEFVHLDFSAGDSAGILSASLMPAWLSPPPPRVRLNCADNAEYRDASCPRPVPPFPRRDGTAVRRRPSPLFHSTKWPGCPDS